MTRDNKPVPEDQDDDFGGMHAADEPTAVWDEKSLRAAGLTDLLGPRPSEPPPPPATAPGSAVPSDPSIVVERLDVPQQQEGPSRPSAPVAEAGFGWPATVAIAVALGAIVYALIRFIRG